MNCVVCLCVTCEVGSGALEKEEEFVQKCMESLSAASSQLDQVRVIDDTFLMHFCGHISPRSYTVIVFAEPSLLYLKAHGSI